MIRVSIIIPCYNRGRFLAATLESVRGQTYSDWECLVVDDGSDDDSVAVAQHFATADSRFRVISRVGDRRGANVCRNQGLSLSQGEYVIFLDSDDLLASTCLEDRAKEMDAAPGFGFSVFLTELFRDRVGDRKVLWNIYTERNDLSRFLSKDPVWHTTGPIWRRQVVASLGGFDEDLLSFQDWDLHVRALSAGIPYFKNAARDHFYRNGHEGGGAISSVSTVRAEHLQSHERLFGRTVAGLKAAGLFDEDRRCRLAGLYWWLAKRQLSGTGSKSAARVWRQAVDLGLCNSRRYFEGCLMLSLYSRRGGSRLANLVQMSWPATLREVGSEHLHRAPFPDALPQRHAGGINRSSSATPAWNRERGLAAAGPLPD